MDLRVTELGQRGLHRLGLQLASRKTDTGEGQGLAELLGFRTVRRLVHPIHAAPVGLFQKARSAHVGRDHCFFDESVGVQPGDGMNGLDVPVLQLQHGLVGVEVQRAPRLPGVAEALVNGLQLTRASLGSCGRREHRPLDRSSGSIGTTRSGRYTELPRSHAHRSSALSGLT